jgi:hypothetical protein
MVDNTVYKVLYEGYEMREEDKGESAVRPTNTLLLIRVGLRGVSCPVAEGAPQASTLVLTI